MRFDIRRDNVTGDRIKLLLGIDGGGTKTEFLLTDLDGTEIGRTVLGTSNPVNIGLDNSKAVLEQGISRICAGFDFDEISVFAGLAGGSPKEIKTEINRFLGEFGFGAYSNGSDTDSVLQLALKGEDGVAVIMGTGIVAFSRSRGELHRTGGWGYMIDRGGSGFHFGSDALDAAFGHIDGRGGSELILRLVEKKLGKKLEESVGEIYGGGAAYVASFAPTVFEAFELGDKKASEIIDRNAYEAAKIINTARAFLENKNGKTVICGGLCRQRSVLKPFLLRYIKGEHTLEFSDEPTVNGATALAKANIGGGRTIC